jgi:hypothetical protein
MRAEEQPIEPTALKLSWPVWNTGMKTRSIASRVIDAGMILISHSSTSAAMQDWH